MAKIEFKGQLESMVQIEVKGVWGNCNLPIPVLPVREHVHSTVCTLLHGKDWQKAVLGLMLVTVSLCVVGGVLSACGVCAAVLPRRVYFFHSAGEIFCVCALSTGVALTLFTVAVRADLHTFLKLHPRPHPQQSPGGGYRYGAGYWAGWGGALSLLLAALLLSLDSVVQEMARVTCCRRRCFRLACWDLAPPPGPGISTPPLPLAPPGTHPHTELRML
ncbi:uncharacterized protein LOC143301734 [Babylonia areolata]|uniref:uncharacterized protein LOC143301734 n=1 Tax=Babylonia areolata TaxID=304850 RepID=UPI003FD44326